MVKKNNNVTPVTGYVGGRRFQYIPSSPDLEYCPPKPYSARSLPKLDAGETVLESPLKILPSPMFCLSPTEKKPYCFRHLKMLVFNQSGETMKQYFAQELKKTFFLHNVFLGNNNEYNYFSGLGAMSQSPLF